MGAYYNEISIEDMIWDAEKRYPCPCGDRLEISRKRLANYEDIAKCPSCSLVIRVVYDPLDYGDYDEEEEEEEEDVSEEEPANLNSGTDSATWCLPYKTKKTNLDFILRRPVSHDSDVMLNTPQDGLLFCLCTVPWHRAFLIGIRSESNRLYPKPEAYPSNPINRDRQLQ